MFEISAFLSNKEWATFNAYQNDVLILWFSENKQLMMIPIMKILHISVIGTVKNLHIQNAFIAVLGLCKIVEKYYYHKIH